MVAALPGKGQDEGLVQLKRRLEGERGVAATTSVSLNPAENTGVFQVYPTTSPQSVATTDLLDHIRQGVIPPIEAKTGARLHVGGINAVFEDFGNAIAGKLPIFIGVVVLLSALLLMTVFRSIWVPLKAVLMNLLSIGAAFGLVVAVFQWGWGASLIGVDNTGPIISLLVPAIMQLLGKRAWSFPGWLDRLLPRLHVEAEEEAHGDLHPSSTPAYGESDA